jgi:hypothetical protein
VQRSSRSERIESFLEETNSGLEMTCTYRSDKELGRVSAVARCHTRTDSGYRRFHPLEKNGPTVSLKGAWTHPC